MPSRRATAGRPRCARPPSSMRPASGGASDPRRPVAAHVGAAGRERANPPVATLDRGFSDPHGRGELRRSRGRLGEAYARGLADSHGSARLPGGAVTSRGGRVECGRVVNGCACSFGSGTFRGHSDLLTEGRGAVCEVGRAPPASPVSPQTAVAVAGEGRYHFPHRAASAVHGRCALPDVAGRECVRSTLHSTPWSSLGWRAALATSAVRNTRTW